MPEEEEVKKEEAPKAKAGPNIIIVIVALLAIQALMAFAVVMFAIPREKDDFANVSADELKNPESEVNPSAAVIGEVVSPVRLEVIVNIAGTDGTRFLKAVISLAYDRRNNANRGMETALAGLETQLRSKVSEYLSSLTITEVNDRNIRRNISSVLLPELNAIIPANAGRLSNVYVEEFIIQ